MGYVLSLLSIGLVGFSQLYAINRTALALGDGRSILVTQGLVASVTAAGALIALAFPAEAIVPVIALGTSIANLAGWGLSVILIRRRFARLGVASAASTATPQLRMMAASVAAIGLTIAATGWWSLPVAGWIGHVCDLLVVALIASGTYCAVAWLLGDRHLLVALQAARARRSEARVDPAAHG